MKVLNDMQKARWFKWKIPPQSLILLFILSILACDPGTHYIPKDWTRTSGIKFSKTFESFDIEISSIGGLIGSTYLGSEVTIHNRTKSPIIIESGLLKANGSIYTAEWTEQNYKDGWDPVPAGQTLKLPIVFFLKKPLYKVLEGHVELKLNLRVENKVKEVIIVFVKEN